MSSKDILWGSYWQQAGKNDLWHLRTDAVVLAVLHKHNGQWHGGVRPNEATDHLPPLDSLHQAMTQAVVWLRARERNK